MTTLSDNVLWPWSSRGKVTLSALSQLAVTSSLRRSRVCFHRTPQDSAQCMLIFLEPASCFHPHLHQIGDESYCLISGDLTIVYFNHDLVVDERSSLQCSAINIANRDNDRSLVALVDAGRWHSIYTTSGAIYLEFRDAPFFPADQISINVKNNIPGDSLLNWLEHADVGSDFSIFEEGR
jgi:cupin fold WbuC family metalloprotein